MKKPKRKRVVQMYLPQPGPPLPAWNGLPEKFRKEIVALTAEILRRHVRADAEAGGGRRE
jgi:hypothetical protein